MTLAGLMALGCGKPSGQVAEQEPLKKPEPQNINISAGEAVRRSEKKERPVLWKVRWEGARLEYVTENAFGGTMTKVSGGIFEHGREVSAFSADEATAFKESDRLALGGHIRLASKEPRMVLSCDEVVWDAGRGVLRAQGNVLLDALDYKAGPFKELWATPSLDFLSTPGLFPKELLNKER